MLNKTIKCTACTTIDSTPNDYTDHIEGFINVIVNQNCEVHGHYIYLNANKNNKFSIELIQYLENKYEEVC